MSRRPGVERGGGASPDTGGGGGASKMNVRARRARLDEKDKERSDRFA